ncbi:MAG: choice-of-anchor D domain-containing protein [Burkholderiales bacterium]|nr:choice-of-anchor D domain-containing protein [Burkholderiales bacterium]
MRRFSNFVMLALLFAAAPSFAQVPCCATQGGVTAACTADGRVVCADGTPSAACKCQGGGLSPPPSTLGQLLMPVPSNFGDQVKDQASPVVTFTLTNYGALPVTVTGITSVAPDEFVVMQTTCGVVPTGKSCTVDVAFKPAAFGARSAQIRVVSTGVGSPQAFLLRGNGTPEFVKLVEYSHSSWNHYFMTSNADEIAKLDNGDFVGWKRTGSEFKAFALGTSGTAAVCRFFSTAFDPRSSHFYTPVASECTVVKSNPSWAFEGEVFGVHLPSASGNCAVDALPLYRLYNNGQGSAPNHRYTTDPAVRDLMRVFGWTPEGVDDKGVIACVPA